MSEICTGCQQPLDLTKPHVKIVRNVEREERAEVTVADSAVLGQWHIEHAPDQLAAELERLREERDEAKLDLRNARRRKRELRELLSAFVNANSGARRSLDRLEQIEQRACDILAQRWADTDFKQGYVAAARDILGDA